MTPHTSDDTVMPLLSILIPVYNVRAFLEPCVESIMAQISDDDRIEVHFVDDASTDGTRELLIAIVQKLDGRVSAHFRETNGGVGAARNDLLARAQGQYFWFIDPDDIVLPGAIYSMIEVLERDAPDMLIFDYEKKGRLIRGFSGPTECLTNDRDALVGGVFAGRMLHAWLRITHRRLWEGVSFPAIRTYEDVATTPILALRANSFYYRALPVIWYRFRKGSLLESVRCGRFDSAKHDEFVIALSSLKSEMQSRLPEVGTETRFAVSHFITKEFIKICYRAIRSGMMRPALRPIGSLMRHYRIELEGCTLIPFRDMSWIYWNRGKLNQSLLTHYCVLRTRGSAGVGGAVIRLR